MATKNEKSEVALQAAFQQDVEHAIKSLGSKTTARKANLLRDLWNKYETTLEPPFLATHMVSAADAAREMQEFVIAQWLYRKYLSSISSEADPTLDSDLMSTFFTGINEATELSEAHRLNAQALIGLALCRFKLSIQQDQLFVSSKTKESCITQAHITQQAMEAVLRLGEPHSWLLYNGTVVLYNICRQLLSCNVQVQKALEYLLWSIMVMESCISLMTVDYLVWRTQLYVAASECYFLLQLGMKGYELAKRCLSMIGELEEVVIASADVDESETKEIFEKSRDCLAFVLFRREGWAARKRRGVSPKSSRKSKVPREMQKWPRNALEDLLSEQFDNDEDRLIAIVLALTDFRRRTVQHNSPGYPSAMKDMPRISPEASTDMCFAGYDVMSRLLEGYQGDVSTLTPTMISFVKLLFSYEEWNLFKKIGAVILPLIPPSECGENNRNSSDDDDDEDAELSAKINYNELPPSLSTLAILRAFVRLNKTKALKLNAAHLSYANDDYMIQPPCWTTRPVFPSDLGDLIEALTTSSTLGCIRNQPKDRDVFIDAALYLWSRVKHYFHRFNTTDTVKSTKALFPDGEVSDRLQALVTIHSVFVQTDHALHDPLVCGEVALKLAVIWKALEQHKNELLVLQESFIAISQYLDRSAPSLVSDHCVSARPALYGLGSRSEPTELVTNTVFSLFTDTVHAMFDAQLSSGASAGLNDTLQMSKTIVSMANTLQSNATTKVSVAQTLLTACGRNNGWKALLSLVMVGRVKSTEKQEKYLREALKYVSLLRYKEEILMAMVKTGPSATMKKLLEPGKRLKILPPPPEIVYVHSETIALRPSAFKTDKPIATYRLFGRTVKPKSEEEADPKVRITDDALSGCGVDIPADSEAIFEVSGLQPNEEYKFAVAAYDAEGKIVGGIGTSTPEGIVTCNPLSLLHIWGLIVNTAYHVNNLDVVEEAMTLLWQQYVYQPTNSSVEETANALANNSAAEPWKLDESMCSSSSGAELRLFFQAVMAYVELKTQDLKLHSPNACKHPMILTKELACVKLCRRVVIAMKVAVLLNDANSIVQALMKCYETLSPLLISDVTLSVSIRVQVTILDVIDSLLVMPTSHLPAIWLDDQVIHMVACISQHVARHLTNDQNDAKGAGHILRLGIQISNRIVDIKNSQSLKKKSKLATQNQQSDVVQSSTLLIDALNNYTKLITGKMASLKGIDGFIASLPKRTLTEAYTEMKSFRKHDRFAEVLSAVIGKAMTMGRLDDAKQWCQQYFSKKRSFTPASLYSSRACSKSPNGIIREDTGQDTDSEYDSDKDNDNDNDNEPVKTAASSKTPNAKQSLEVPSKPASRATSTRSSSPRKVVIPKPPKIRSRKARRRLLNEYAIAHPNSFPIVESDVNEEVTAIVDPTIAEAVLDIQEKVSALRFQRKETKARVVITLETLHQQGPFIAQIHLQYALALFRSHPVCKTDFPDTWADLQSTTLPQAVPSSTATEVPEIQQICIHFTRAVVIAARSNAWGIVQNVCRAVFNAYHVGLGTKDWSPHFVKLFYISSLYLVEAFKHQSGISISVVEKVKGANALKPQPLSDGHAAGDYPFVKTFLLNAMMLFARHGVPSRVIDIGGEILEFAPAEATAAAPLVKAASLTEEPFTAEQKEVIGRYFLLLGIEDESKLAKTTVRERRAAAAEKAKQEESKTITLSFCRTKLLQYLNPNATPLDPSVGSAHPLPESTLKTVVAAYKERLAISSKKLKSSPTTLFGAIELGCLLIQQGNKAEAEDTWRSGLHSLLGGSKTYSEMCSQLEEEPLLEKINSQDRGIWGLLAGISLCGHLARYIFSGNADLRIQVSILGSLLSERLIKCNSLKNWKQTADFVTFRPAQVAPGLPLFEDRFRCNAAMFAEALESMCETLTATQSPDNAVRVLPAVALLEYTMEVAGSVPGIVRARIMRVRAAMTAELLPAASCIMLETMQGYHIPCSDGISPISFTTEPMQFPSLSASANPISDISSPVLEHLLNDEIPAAVKAVYGPSLSALVQTTEQALVAKLMGTMVIHPGNGHAKPERAKSGVSESRMGGRTTAAPSSARVRSSSSLDVSNPFEKNVKAFLIYEKVLSRCQNLLKRCRKLFRDNSDPGMRQEAQEAYVETYITLGHLHIQLHNFRYATRCALYVMSFLDYHCKEGNKVDKLSTQWLRSRLLVCKALLCAQNFALCRRECDSGVSESNECGNSAMKCHFLYLASLARLGQGEAAEVVPSLQEIANSQSTPTLLQARVKCAIGDLLSSPSEQLRSFEEAIKSIETSKSMRTMSSLDVYDSGTFLLGYCHLRLGELHMSHKLLYHLDQALAVFVSVDVPYFISRVYVTFARFALKELLENSANIGRTLESYQKHSSTLEEISSSWGSKSKFEPLSLQRIIEMYATATICLEAKNSGCMRLIGDAYLVLARLYCKESPKLAPFAMAARHYSLQTLEAVLHPPSSEGLNENLSPALRDIVPSAVLQAAQQKSLSEFALVDVAEYNLPPPRTREVPVLAPIIQHAATLEQLRIVGGANMLHVLAMMQVEKQVIEAGTNRYQAQFPRDNPHKRVSKQTTFMYWVPDGTAQRLLYCVLKGAGDTVGELAVTPEAKSAALQQIQDALLTPDADLSEGFKASLRHLFSIDSSNEDLVFPPLDVLERILTTPIGFDDVGEELCKFVCHFGSAK